MEHQVTIKDVHEETHDVRSFIVEKPKNYSFVPGQGAQIALDKEGWRDEARPFTFCSLRDDPHLEFVIKIYSDHDGMTNQLGDVEPGDQFLLGNAWGAIQYKGPGVFLAGGAGVTPFIAILRDLYRKNKIDGNKLLFSNKTEEDIILQDEFQQMLGDNFINTLTREENPAYEQGRIDKQMLQKYIDDFDQHFYLCGPMQFVKELMSDLKDLGVETDGLVFEN